MLSIIHVKVKKKSRVKKANKKKSLSKRKKTTKKKTKKASRKKTNKASAKNLLLRFKIDKNNWIVFYYTAAYIGIFGLFALAIYYSN
tara:strand:+ start:637 stop:897 length:261 start_codon:yes stop_codon:yes gene_type:complete